MNQMAFTCLPNFNHQHMILPNFSKIPLLSSKTHSSYSHIINFPSSLKCATFANLGVDLNNEDDHSEELCEALEEELMPKHIAMIVDGNRRWATRRGLSGKFGHSAGRMMLMPLLQRCCKLKIKVVSLFLFSTENWIRPTEEVNFLMQVVLEDLLRIDAEELFSLGCRVNVMGNKAKLSSRLQKLSAEIEQKSRTNSGTHINFAINYSGKYDITQACKIIATKVKDGVIRPNQINENIFKRELETKKLIDFPYPDLVIRTSGEFRLSNFMLWQMAYSELYFVKKCFPDFKENDLVEALLVYQERRRHLYCINT